MELSSAVKCPECGSERPSRDGLRYLADGRTVQRWLCRLCGYRFSKPDVKLDVSPKTFEGSQPVMYEEAMRLERARCKRKRTCEV